jgi:leader peptidase (prepilin peptidase)/N-methyltransferase
MFSSLALSPKKAAIALALGAVGAAIGYFLGPPERQLFVIPIAFLLAWAVVVDIDRYILPDFITLGLIVGGLIVAWTTGPQVFIDSVIGAAAGYAVLVAVELWYRHVLKRDGLGRGDAKLLAAAGAWLGWAPLALVMLFASLAGLAFALVQGLRAGKLDGKAMIAFGPFIALGFWAAYVFPQLFPVFRSGL